jgi:DNA polymerase IV
MTDLPGISKRMEARLKNAGIKTVEQFWRSSPRQARQIWGSVLGERMWHRLHGAMWKTRRQKSASSAIRAFWSLH